MELEYQTPAKSNTRVVLAIAIATAVLVMVMSYIYLHRAAHRNIPKEEQNAVVLYTAPSAL